MINLAVATAKNYKIHQTHGLYEKAMECHLHTSFFSIKRSTSSLQVFQRKVTKNIWKVERNGWNFMENYVMKKENQGNQFLIFQIRVLFNVFVRIVRVIMLKVVGKLFIILTILSFIVLTFDENLSYLNRGYIRNLIWAVVAFTMITLEVFFELFK